MTEQPKQPTDIFKWANTTDSYKDQLDIDLFLFSKGFSVYATQYDAALKQQLKVLFLNEMMSAVEVGAASGMKVCDVESIDRDDNILLHAGLDKVEHAQEVVEQILYGEDTLEVFSEGDHEFKKIKGMIAKFTPPKRGDVQPKPFFVVKLLASSQVMIGSSAWLFSGTKFGRFEAEAGLKVTPDNQVLIVGEDIFIFSESKFERLFGYSAKKFAIAKQNLAAIEEKFKFSLPDGLTFEALIQENQPLVNKLQSVDGEGITQEALLDQADVMGLELMEDTAEKAIIIMDHRDAGKFLNLLSDDYLHSEMTGKNYIVKSKKPLKNEEKS